MHMKYTIRASHLMQAVTDLYLLCPLNSRFGQRGARQGHHCLVAVPPHASAAAAFSNVIVMPNARDIADTSPRHVQRNKPCKSHLLRGLARVTFAPEVVCELPFCSHAHCKPGWRRCRRQSLRRSRRHWCLALSTVMGRLRAPVCRRFERWPRGTCRQRVGLSHCHITCIQGDC